MIDKNTIANARVTFYKNKYCIILNTSLTTINSGYLNTLITYDVVSKEYDILSGYKFVDVLGLVSENLEKLVAILNDGNSNKIVQIEETGKVQNNATSKLWQSAYTDLGYPNYEKAISRISLQTRTDCSVDIETDKDKLTVNSNFKVCSFNNKFIENISHYIDKNNLSKKEKKSIINYLEKNKEIYFTPKNILNEVHSKTQKFKGRKN